MLLKLSIIVLLLALLFQGIQNRSSHPDLELMTPEMIIHHGYECEIHKVTTEDGYILTVHRIPNPSNPPVLLNHGLMMSSVDYVIIGPGKALAYLLHDAGFDVWIGNARGNVYSKEHKYLKISDPKYWRFSFHEMGLYDVTAEIDYILDKTDSSKLTYIGFSMGTTMFWVMTSLRPEYNDKILEMHALAPTAYRGTKGRNFNFAKRFFTTTTRAMNFLNMGEYLPNTPFNSFTARLCDSVNLCRGFLSIYGQGSNQIDSEILPVLVSHFPAGTSTQTMQHVSQLLDIDRFWQFDYGLEQNLAIYNSSKPPEYNLSNVAAPVYIHYSEKDSLASPANVKKLCSLIQNCMELRMVSDPDFVHLDFTWGSGARELIYDHMMSIMKKS